MSLVLESRGSCLGGLGVKRVKTLFTFIMISVKSCSLHPDLRTFKVFRNVYPQRKNFLVAPQPSGAQTVRLDGLEVQLVSPVDLMAKI